MDTIHHRPLYPSPVYPANLFDVTNCQNERLFKQGIGIFFKPIGKCVKKKFEVNFLLPVNICSVMLVGGLQHHSHMNLLFANLTWLRKVLFLF